MKMTNAKGEAIYFNAVTKNNKEQYVIKALSGQAIFSRDRKAYRSRTFTQLAQAERWLERNVYKCTIG